MNILLVYPETPFTFHSYKDALKFISKKSAEPPLGLLTVASLLPGEWNKRLVDMNVISLKDKDILWADYVFLSGMNIHRDSFERVVKRCNHLETKVVAGGPLVTTEQKSILGVDHFILNEAEATLPGFIDDLKDGHPKGVYASPDYPDITSTPVPMWELLDFDSYASMSVQYSRGCPFNCEFCSITMLNGRKPRTKDSGQFVRELEALYEAGWRGGVFIVDDNFIGNRAKLKSELLPALIEWGGTKKHPFSYSTEVSINLVDDEELVELMVAAGFTSTFIGIETPNQESLMECGKSQNLERDLLDSVKKLQRKGLMVSAGFIVGFDHDPPDIFERQIRFIQKSGIVSAMVGLLNVPTGTRLFKRMKSEKRLLSTTSGNNMDGSLNFIPKIKYQKLGKGYKKILDSIYSQKGYYERVKIFLKEYQPRVTRIKKIKPGDIIALWKAIWKLGVVERGKRYFWKLFFLSLFKYPKKFATSITLAVYGYHFRRIIAMV